MDDKIKYLEARLNMLEGIRKHSEHLERFSEITMKIAESMKSLAVAMEKLEPKIFEEGQDG